MMNRFLTAACAATMVFAAGCGSSGGPNYRLFAADGSYGSSGFLYAIDPDAGEIKVVGGLADSSGDTLYSLTGLVFGSDGVLYGSTSDDAPVQDNVFVSIDTQTAEVTEIDIESDDDECFDAVGDLEIVDGTIYGVSDDGAGDTGCFLTVTTDGTVEMVTDGFGWAGGLAYDAAADALYHLTEGGSTLDTVDLESGELDEGIDVDDPVDDYDGMAYSYVKAMAMVDGRLLAIMGTYYDNSVLVEIDTDSGNVTVLTPVPDSMDALAAIR
ncbi:MAG: hypothetical protein KIT79_06630 [Deltaproteobacteria bacterium]|nr:hypothetical protein [Deltaproteobacteria bacterium]